jgi:hypothetical protein
LYYFGGRYYDPEIGQFISEDPGQDGTNWYGYCGNDPIKYFDPNGQAKTSNTQLMYATFERWINTSPEKRFGMKDGIMFPEQFQSRLLREAVYGHVNLSKLTITQLDKIYMEEFGYEYPKYLRFGTAAQMIAIAPGAKTSTSIAYTRTRMPVIGNVEPPIGVKAGSTTFGNIMHERIATWLRGKYPNTQFILRTRPGLKGMDAEWIKVEGSVNPGFRYLEIKPRSISGLNTFNKQVSKWGYSDVKVITYDEYGNLFWGW